MTEFEAVYRAYCNDIYRYLLALSRDPILAEELTAETFFHALQSVDRFRGECAVGTWLRTIARNCFLTHKRRADRRRHTETPLLSEPPAPDDLFASLADRDEAGRIHRILLRLPPPYQKVFSLRVLGELSFRQIGALFGKSDHWACVTFHRAKEKIRKELNLKDEPC